MLPTMEAFSSYLVTFGSGHYLMALLYFVGPNHIIAIEHFTIGLPPPDWSSQRL